MLPTESTEHTQISVLYSECIPPTYSHSGIYGTSVRPIESSRLPYVGEASCHLEWRSEIDEVAGSQGPREK